MKKFKNKFLPFLILFGVLFIFSGTVHSGAIPLHWITPLGQDPAAVQTITKGQLFSFEIKAEGSNQDGIKIQCVNCDEADFTDKGKGVALLEWNTADTSVQVGAGSFELKATMGSEVITASLFFNLKNSAAEALQWDVNLGNAKSPAATVEKGKAFSYTIKVKPAGSGISISCTNCTTAKVEDKDNGEAVLTWDAQSTKDTTVTTPQVSFDLEAKKGSEVLKGRLYANLAQEKPNASAATGESTAAAKRKYMFDEEEAAAIKAQQEKIEGLAKGTFNKLGDRTPQKIFGGVIRSVTGIVGSIALAMFVYGGIMIMSSGGNAERTKQGTQIIVWSALGVVVILTSYALIDLVFDVFR